MAFRFQPTRIPEVIGIMTDRHEDQRGLFAELYKSTEFVQVGIDRRFNQIDYSRSYKNIVRGLHYQLNPMAQAKIVSVIHGRVFDVAVDLRKGSPTYGRWVALELTPEGTGMLYIPEGFAHGFCTLSDEAEIIYHCSQVYSKEHERGLCWDDPAVGIDWPVKSPVLSERDRQHPLLAEAENNFVYLNV